MEDKLKKLILLMEIKNEEKFSDFSKSIEQLDKQDLNLSNDIDLLYKEISKIEGDIKDFDISEQIKELKSDIENIQLQKGDKGDDGKDYILTDSDKEEISKLVEVPVVEKIIEKVETVKEVPIITNEIKEVAKYENAEQIVEKINTLENVIDIKTIKDFPKIEGNADIKRQVDTIGNQVLRLMSKQTQSVDLSGYVPTSRTLTINGTTLDLSANRSWSVGTVTSVAALTLGTSGTDLSSTVATGTTTPVITLNVPTASATNRGALSSADWTTFNSKFTLPSLTAGSVLFSNGTTIAQDNANFFWDDTNNRLGLGTASPAYKLEINAGSTSGILQQITTSGNDSLLRISSVSRYVKIGVDNLYGARFDTNAGGFAMPDAGDIVPTSNGTVTNLTTNLGRSGVAFGNIFANLANFAGSGTNYFAGKIGIGQSSATARLHLPAGTATAGSSPLKFTSGTVLSTTEAGAFEFNGDDYFGTITTGAGATYTSAYPPSQSSTYVKSTTQYNATLAPYLATDPTKTLTGSYISNSWLSSAPNNVNQRFHIDLGSAKVITRIYYENQHESGTLTAQGAKDFTLWGTNDATAFSTLTYGTDTNWTQISTSSSSFAQHVAANTTDPQYITATNSTAYRYYAIKIANNWGDASYMGFRRVELQTGGSARKAFVMADGSNLVAGRIPYTTTNGRLIDSLGLVFTGTALGIGQSTPTALLHLGAGTATTSTAPLKFTAGTNLTTPEAGVMEFTTGNFWFSPSTTNRIRFGHGGSGLSGTTNIVFGIDSGTALTTGSAANTYIGRLVGTSQTNGIGNTGIGSGALGTHTGYTGNTAIGEAAMYYGSANQNTAIGDYAMFSDSAVNTSTGAVAIGANAFYKKSAGNYAIAIGYNAGLTVSTAAQSIIIGYNAVNGGVHTGTDTIAIGTEAGKILTSGTYNILIGYRAGDTITTGSNNVIIGKDIDAQGATTSDQLSIQNAIFGTGNTGTGTTASTGKIGIFAPAPNSSLQVTGSMSQNYVAKTANYTLDGTDYLVDCTANSFTVTLPTAVGITGRIYIIKNTGTATIITMATTSSQTIDGTTPPTITTLTPLRVMSDGANWITI